MLKIIQWIKNSHFNKWSAKTTDSLSHAKKLIWTQTLHLLQNQLKINNSNQRLNLKCKTIKLLEKDDKKQLFLMKDFKPNDYLDKPNASSMSSTWQVPSFH